jgi:tetratricopeptide (TPR) repeat protein
MESVDAALDAAASEVRQGNLADARERLDAATRSYPEDVQVWTRLGDVLRRLHQYADSLRVLQHAVELAPDDVNAQIALVDALRLDYRAAEALNASLRLIERVQDDPRAQVVHARALIDTDQPNKALPILSQLTVAHPEGAEYWVSLGRAMVRMGRFSEADQLARKVIENLPRHTTAHLVLAAANHGLLRDAEWMAATLKAHELDPGGPQPLLWMAKIGERSEDAEREKRYLLAALAAQPRLVEAHVQLGSLLWRDGDLAAAERAFLEALSAAPLDGMAQGMMATFRVDTGRGETDLHALEHVAEQRPYSRLAFYLGRLFLTSVVDHRRAIRMLELAAAHATESVETLQLLGQAYLFDRQWQRGLEVLQRAVALCPRAGEAWRGIGVAAQNLDDDTTADAALAQTAALLPDSAQAHFDRGLFLASRRPREAIVELKRAVALEASGQNLYVLAEAHEQAGELDAALAVAQQAKRALPADDADIDELLARIEAARRAR